MTATKILERRLENQLGARLLSLPPLARAIKRVAAYPRYAAQYRACRAGFKRFGSQYPQPVLFIAGLPKSGTTWLEDMIASYPGFHDVYLPEVAAYELRTGVSHDFQLPPETFLRFKNMLVVVKMHTPGSLHNVETLRAAGINYAVLYRDLRDVAVSYFFFVRGRPWHPEYPLYAGLSLPEGLALFAERTLLTYAHWVKTWRQNRDPELSLELKYEQILAHPAATLTQVADHFGLDSSPVLINKVIAMNSFKKSSGGRGQGHEDQTSFFRKGVAGDWRNHFTAELKTLYKGLIGAFLIEFGYEQDLSW